MKRIGLIGCGKIGQAILKHVKNYSDVEVVFVQDPNFKTTEKHDFSVLEKGDSEFYAKADLIIECATADVLKCYASEALAAASLLTFSVTAFSDDTFRQQMHTLSHNTGHQIYIPHGAILGLDGIFDGHHIWDSVKIVTTKNPKSLGRDDLQRTVIYAGPTRQACTLFPRNVNVHASIALAGIGFDRTESVIVADPAVETNAHHIYLDGVTTHMELIVSSIAQGAVSGAYTPQSACGSIDRILQITDGLFFV